MKVPFALIAAPFLVFLTACSSHYSASTHGHYGHRSHHGGHVSVGVHGGHHGRGAGILGALVVGGVIGHLLTEAARDDEPAPRQVVHSSNNDELVNGYSIEQNQLTEEQNRWYQLGKDGKCYLMQRENGQAEIVSLVPNAMCP